MSDDVAADDAIKDDCRGEVDILTSIDTFDNDEEGGLVGVFLKDQVFTQFNVALSGVGAPAALCRYDEGRRQFHTANIVYTTITRHVLNSEPQNSPDSARLAV